MNWLEQVNKVMDYIEENLTNEINYEELDQLACCSRYHFSKMFTSIMGVTLSEYI
ncbi:helix-turn-helix transcriptional regulator [Sporosalibacterium faouarense]|uniref:helix-turn-helix transcriptional regulator n=1 Tax=Sporosalibacterium faouarense TaxID=516123 RepID=UPI001FAEAB3F|nr:AraC family transcriptional regulator [Sporosalibacterium faouarense]